MKIGLIKSKVEKLLIESYQTNTFKEEVKNFKENVLENKKIAKAFSIYDELSKNSNLSESKANKYLNVSSKLFLDLLKDNIQEHSELQEFYLEFINEERRSP